jgi:citrate synthase
MSEIVKINIEGKDLECPVIVSTEGEKAIDISKLRSTTGYITMDPGFGNTGSCKSSITYLDGDKGILRFRGIPIEQLAEQSTFIETAFLLFHGHLPTQTELDKFSDAFTEHSMIHEDIV